MNGKPLVTIVIPVYKVEKYLRRCIESILTQSYKKTEIIIVDDGSPDACPIICDEFAGRYDNITVLHKTNGGLSDARNHGLSLAKGEYVLFLDSDDTLVVDALEGMIDIALRNNSDVVVPDRYLQVEETTNKADLRYHYKKLSNYSNPVNYVLDILIDKGRAWRASALIYRTKIIKENIIKFPMNEISEDLFFNLSFFSVAKKMNFYNKPTLIYLKRKGSITTSFNELLGKSIINIYHETIIFLKRNHVYSSYNFELCKKLLCRNSILYISKILSNNCTWEKDRKFYYINSFLNNRYVKEAFKRNSINPYFDRKLTTLYFKLSFYLIKRHKIVFLYYITKNLSI